MEKKQTQQMRKMIKNRTQFRLCTFCKDPDICPEDMRIMSESTIIHCILSYSNIVCRISMDWFFFYLFFVMGFSFVRSFVSLFVYLLRFPWIGLICGCSHGLVYMTQQSTPNEINTTPNVDSFDSFAIILNAYFERWVCLNAKQSQRWWTENICHQQQWQQISRKQHPSLCSYHTISSQNQKLSCDLSNLCVCI